MSSQNKRKGKQTALIQSQPSPLPVLTQTQQQAAKKYITETETETDSAMSDVPNEAYNKLSGSSAKQDQSSSAANAANGHQPAPVGQDETKLRSIKTRVISAMIMITGFFLIITMGHIYCAILVLNLAFLMYKEIISLKRKENKEQLAGSLFSWIDWYYFAAFAFLMIPNLFVRRVLVEGAIPNGTFLHFILFDYHKLISFGLFMFGILLFVWSLERGSYRYQFQRFAWSFLALIMVFCVPTFISYNVYKGIYWFVFPQLCVIVNDVMAYVFGMWLGKTPLIKLSPKKTWEGFIGGMFSTFAIAFILTDVLSTSKFLVCPQTHLDFSLFEEIECEIPDIFKVKSYDLPFGIGSFMGYNQFQASPAQIHSLVIASFASLIAPFGGFFASGVKRAFRIKDFGDTIPGHGGITDRFDCHGLMGIFIYIYLTQVVFRSADSFEKVLDLVNSMTFDDKTRLLELLKQDILLNVSSAITGN